jgi:hypothetical protein
MKTRSREIVGAVGSVIDAASADGMGFGTRQRVRDAGRFSLLSARWSAAMADERIDAPDVGSLPPRSRDDDLDAIGEALGESFYLSSQGMSEWPTLDECKAAGRRAAREIDHRITDWQFRTKDEWTRALRHALPRVKASFAPSNQGGETDEPGN